jgi:hypothetical protein
LYEDPSVYSEGTMQSKIETDIHKSIWRIP